MGSKVILMVLIIAGIHYWAALSLRHLREENCPVYEGSKVYSAPSFYYQIMGIPTEGVTVEVYFVENGRCKENS